MATILSPTRERAARVFQEAELAFIDHVRQLADQALAGDLGFGAFSLALRADLGELNRCRYDAHAAFVIGFSSETVLEILGKVVAEPLDDAERQYLEDLKGYLDYAVRNSLSFTSIVGVVSHDFFEGIDLHKGLRNAIKRGFRPGVSGWAAKNQEWAAATFDDEADSND